MSPLGGMTRKYQRKSAMLKNHRSGRGVSMSWRGSISTDRGDDLLSDQPQIDALRRNPRFNARLVGVRGVILLELLPDLPDYFVVNMTASHNVFNYFISIKRKGAVLGCAFRLRVRVTSSSGLGYPVAR
jgi:hypothetical protein